MAVKVGQRKDKPGWWVFIHYRGKRTKRCFGEGKKGERKANEFPVYNGATWTSTGNILWCVA